MPLFTVTRYDKWRNAERQAWDVNWPERVIEEARIVDYARMLLDTLPTMTGAQRLYEQLGFRGRAAVPPQSDRGNPVSRA